MKVLGNGFDLQTTVKIHMYEVDASVNQSAVTHRNRVFFYPHDKLKRLFAEIIDTFFHRLKRVDLLNIPVTQLVSLALVQTAQNGVVDCYGDGRL